MASPGDESHLDPVSSWATSGAMALTGPAEGSPLGPPAPLVGGLRAIADRIVERTAALGHRVHVHPLEILTSRAAISGLERRGQTSCGGATRLLRTADGWMALSLARPDDVDLVAPLIGRPVDGATVWADLAEHIGTRRSAALVGAGRELGLPIAALPDPAQVPEAGPACQPSQRRPGIPRTDLGRLVVVDLSSLWAGPLCASLLACAGAEVWKVESTRRPDGARAGPREFFDLLNTGKRSVAVDFTTPAGRRALHDLVQRADIVIEASRPRALRHLGVDCDELLTAGHPKVWVSITAHGRAGGSDRVGFGDDTAVAGGLVAWDGEVPFFCADAIADPVTGLAAAAACLDALVRGGSWLLDVSMAGVAATLAGPTLPVPPGMLARPPQLPPIPARGPALGAHTEAVLASLAAGE